MEYGYDNASRLTSITYKQKGTTVLGNLTYEYDQNGNRTKTGGSFARTGVPQAIANTKYNAANQQTIFGDKNLKRGQVPFSLLSSPSSISILQTLRTSCLSLVTLAFIRR